MTHGRCGFSMPTYCAAEEHRYSLSLFMWGNISWAPCTEAIVLSGTGEFDCYLCYSPRDLSAQQREVFSHSSSFKKKNIFSFQNLTHSINFLDSDDLSWTQVLVKGLAGLINILTWALWPPSTVVSLFVDRWGSWYLHPVTDTWLAA